MDGAYVELTVANNGTTADVTAVVTTTAGKQYHQYYKGIVIDGPLYFCLTVEGAYIEIEREKVGLTDCSTPWWTYFSRLEAVPAGKTLYKTFTN